MVADNLQHGCRVGSLFEGLSEFGAVEEFGDVGEGVKVLLKLALGNEEEHDEIHRLVIERIEINTLFRAAERAHHLVNEISRGVRDADSKANARTHRGFPLFDHGRDGIVMLGLDFARGDEIVDKLIDGFPAIAGVHAGKNLLGAKNIA